MVRDGLPWLAGGAALWTALWGLRELLLLMHRAGISSPEAVISSAFALF